MPATGNMRPASHGPPPVGFARIGFVLVLLLASGTGAQAKPAHKQALDHYFGTFLAKRLNNCQTCHVPEQPGEAKEDTAKPHNPFGARLKAVRKELNQAGKNSDIPARLELVAGEDSDGDGVANFVELLTGHGPGDPKDTPSAAELEKYQKTAAAFEKYRNSYPWRPFEVVKRPAVPGVKNVGWVKNPIDAFIAAEHEAHDLAPRPDASRSILLRRVTLDLIGLPPTVEEQRAFLADTSPDAYEKVVERLLASPHYGERWGRHWMDVWRYSDWAGWNKEVRDSQPHIWHWRDWIIESLNEDKGYERMVQEMLAADELAPEDTNALRATGYLVRNYKRYSREKWLQDTVDHTAQAFLGVTLACARCHDHMFDPILQKEYYQVRAVFAPYNIRTDRLPGHLDTAKDGLARVYDAELDVKTFLLIRGDDRNPDKEPISPGVPELLGGKFPNVQPVQLPLAGHSPDQRPFVLKETLAESAANVPKARQAAASARSAACQAVLASIDGHPLRVVLSLSAAQKPLDALDLAGLEVSLAETRHAALSAAARVQEIEGRKDRSEQEMKQSAAEATAAHKQLAVWEARHKHLMAQQALRQIRSSDAAKRAAGKKAVVEAEQALVKAEKDAKKPASSSGGKPAYPATSTGRRLAFARWLTERENPLTARVAMNHIWLRHFGQALVPTVSEFGRNGRPPAHPALLDWLAAEFMDKGWSMKKMHRLIVTSNTYRQAATLDLASANRDPDNIYLWHMPSRRLEAELVRDGIFFLAGRLDKTMGGPELDQADGLKVPRRSVYFRHAAEKQMEFLKIFDCAAVTECYQRKESVMPQQALALANSELTIRHARLMARSLAGKTGSDAEAFTAAAFEHVLCRPPTADERAECLAFLKQQTDRHRESQKQASVPSRDEGQPAGDPALRARENLVHVLLNHNDFVTVR